MPRLTKQQYLVIRSDLCRLWLQSPREFMRLNTREQRQLHDFYVFAIGLGDKDALEHRERITYEQPALPQQAGRAMAHLQRGDVTARAVMVSLHDGKRLTVRLRVRPKPDAKRMAQALLDLARQMLDKKSKN